MKNLKDLDLENLSPPKGMRKKRKRVGRGQGSGWGETAGAGVKGQKARAGASIPAGFEGGQMPLYRRIPKTGFRSLKNILGLNIYHRVTLSDLERFDAASVINYELLVASGVVRAHRNKRKVKILANGELTKKLTIQVDSVSEAAKAKIEALGGTVEILAAEQS